MKIILFADRLPPLIGGMETHAHCFAQYFYGRNYDIDIVSKQGGDDVLVDRRYRPIKRIDAGEWLHAFGGGKVVLFFNSGRWIERLTEFRRLLPDAFNMYRTGGNEIIQASLPADVPDYAERKRFWTDAINGAVDKLITNSAFTEARLIEAGINPDILCRAAGGVDKDVILGAVKKRAATRKRYGITDGDKLAVSCTRLVPYKRPDFLLRALSLCKTPLTAVIAGDGPMREQAESLARSLAYPVKFTSALDNARAVELIAAADVYVQASCDCVRTVPGGSYVHTEGMGRSLLEAVCCGVPVAVTRCGAVGEYINTQNGALADGEASLASAVDGFLSGGISFPDNIERYTALYSFDAVFERYISLWT